MELHVFGKLNEHMNILKNQFDTLTMLKLQNLSSSSDRQLQEQIKSTVQRIGSYFNKILDGIDTLQKLKQSETSNEEPTKEQRSELF